MQVEIRQAREKDALVKENPFAAFLATRSPAPKSTSSSAPVWPSPQRQDADPVLLAVGKASREALTRPAPMGLGWPSAPAGDHFATFLELGPNRQMRRTASEASPPKTEQLLRQEVARAKRQLLEVTLQTESRALDPATKQDDVAQELERLRMAQDVLTNPIYSQDRVTDGSALMMDASAAASPMPTGSNWGQTTRWSPLSTSTSMPNIQSQGQASSSSFLPNINGDASRPNQQADQAKDEKPEPMLSGWWSKTRCWNIGISKRDHKARRQTLGLPGGTVVVGNGRLPNFDDSKLLAKGYFYAFQIDEVDDHHFPLDGLKDMSLVFGVSRYPARHRSCLRPMYAYEVADVVLLGYGGNLVDKGKWTKTSWDSKDLKVGDVVGLLVTEEGDFVVYVNQEQVLRVKTSLNDSTAQASSTNTPKSAGSSPSAARRASRRASLMTVKRTLFPIVDLHGRVSAVTILARQAPPNVPVQPRNKLPQ